MLFDLLKALFLGIVQGITEWLPISSTGHLLLFEEWIPFSDAVSLPVQNLFTVVIQLGSILAVAVLYFKRLNPLSRRMPLEEKRRTFALWGKIILAAVPAAAAGLLLNDFIKEVAYNSRSTKYAVIAGALLLYGILFLFIERRKGANAPLQRAEDVTPKKALAIGCFQMLALIPGTSRSGSTIIGSTLLGVSRPAAAEFSFFLAIPMMVGASGLDLLKYVLDYGFVFNLTEILVLLVGTLVSFLVSLAVIRFLMGFLRKHSFVVFGWYRIALGIALLAFYYLA